QNRGAASDNDAVQQDSGEGANLEVALGGRGGDCAKLRGLGEHRQIIVDHWVKIKEWEISRRQQGDFGASLGGCDQHPIQREQEKYKSQAQTDPKQHFGGNVPGASWASVHSAVTPMRAADKAWIIRGFPP